MVRGRILGSVGVPLMLIVAGVFVSVPAGAQAPSNAPGTPSEAPRESKAVAAKKPPRSACLPALHLQSTCW